MQAWQAGFQEANPDATVEYDPVGSGGGRETFLAGGSDFAGSDAYMDDEELRRVGRAVRRRPGRDQPAALHLADRRGLQPARRRRAEPVAGDDRRDLLRRHHDVERRGDRRRQPRRRAARHGDQPGAPLGRVGHDAELHRSTSAPWRPTCGRTSRPRSGPTSVARVPRAPAVSSPRSLPVRVRSATPTPRRSVISGRPRWGRRRVRRVQPRGGGQAGRGVDEGRGSQRVRPGVRPGPGRRPRPGCIRSPSSRTTSSACSTTTRRRPTS